MSVSQNSSLLLSVVLLFMIQLLPSTRAAPINCEGNSEKFKNCAELYKCGQTTNGVYAIDPDGSGAFNVYCDQTTAGGGWTVIQKRVNRTADFNRTWKEYKNGFGNFYIRDFWLGLDKIQRLTQNKTENKLRVDLGVTDYETVYAEYEGFGIENVTNHYKLHIGSFSAYSTVKKDSLSYHNGTLFSTWNRSSTDRVCTPLGGGWWYRKNCRASSNLNGIYPPNKTTAKLGINQIRWGNLNDVGNDNQAPKRTEMKIRRNDFLSWVSGGEGFCMC